MKLPRDLSAEDLVQKLKHLGYRVTRQSGSHIRLTSTQQGEHHITIPNHTPLLSELGLEANLLNVPEAREYRETLAVVERNRSSFSPNAPTVASTRLPADPFAEGMESSGRTETKNVYQSVAPPRDRSGNRGHSEFQEMKKRERPFRGVSRRLPTLDSLEKYRA